MQEYIGHNLCQKVRLGKLGPENWNGWGGLTSPPPLSPSTNTIINSYLDRTSFSGVPG
jgi:hypothetical protein